MSTRAVSQLRVLVKKLLKKNGLTYDDLAKALGLSVPAVKRLMTKGDFTITRLEQIAAIFGLSLFEFMSMANNVTIMPYEFTFSQEATLAKKPRALYLLLLLGAGLSLTEASERSQLNPRDLQSCLIILDKLNVIEFNKEGKVRILARGPYKWLSNGPLQKKFLSAYLRELTSLVTARPTQDSLQIPFELYTSPDLLEQMKAELQNVFKKFRSLSRIDHEIGTSKEIKAVSGLIMLKPFDTWGALLRDQAD